MNKYYTLTPCIICGDTADFTVDIHAYIAWQDSTLIQVAFPNLTPTQREFIMTSRCGACQDLPYNGMERHASIE